MGEVAEFVYADIVGNVFGCADQPPVEAYACGFAAHAPEGFGGGQRGGGGEQLRGAGVVFETGNQVTVRLPFQKVPQQRKLFFGRAFGDEDFRRHQQDLRVLMGGKGKLPAVEPDMFGQSVCRIVRRCFRQCPPQDGFVFIQPAVEGGDGEAGWDADADGMCADRADNQVFLGTAVDFDGQFYAV